MTVESSREQSNLPAILKALFGRTAILAAHPDDETIGTGGHLAMVPQPFVLIATDGAPADPRDLQAAGCASRRQYARLRRSELMAAMSLTGIAPSQVECFGIADQELSLCMSALARRLARWMHDRAIGLVLTHAYEMGHPDHDAVAFAVHGAVELLRRQVGRPPRIVEFTSYHRGENGEIACGTFLSHGDPGEAFPLSPARRNLKRRMLDAYASQRRTLQPFDTLEERFRPAPAYSFTAPPHHRGAFYDDFDWGMRSERWLVLAAEALTKLEARPC